MSKTIDLKVECTNKLVQENEALRAQVFSLQAKLNLITNKLEEYCFMPDGIDESEVIRNLCLSTPDQCLAGIKAQAVERFVYSLDSLAYMKRELIEEAKKLRQEAKGGEL